LTNTEPLKLGGIDLRAVVGEQTRLSALIWGPSGCGKTTLAATAPGRKLYLMWDADGASSLGHRDIIDGVVMPLYEASDSILDQFKHRDPMNIERFLKDNPDIQTVVVDSLTSFGERALSYGVVKAQSTAKGKSSTIEDPGFAGYGNKNTWTHLMISNLLASTARTNRHCVFIAHEGAPDKNEQGAAISITMILGSNLSREVPIKINEVWAMYDTGKTRMIAIRPCRMRTPMKTRMFETSGEPEFVLNYDPLRDSDDKAISGWYDKWKKNGFKKIPLPK
jgi:hypothetical protein